MQEKKTGINYRRLIGSLLLIGALLATQLPVADVEANTSSPSDFRMNGSTLIGYTGTATTVSVPDSIKTIGAGAFSGDTDLYTVYLPKNLEKIENDAFAGCSLLTVVDIPDTLKEIGDFAFSGCTSLSEVELGEKVTKIGDGAFAGCSSLAEIKLHKDNSSFVNYGGALYDMDKTKLIQVYAGSAYSKYTMPETVREMRPYAFWGCDKLRFAALSSNLKEIPLYGMSNCGLEEIVLPYSLNLIDFKAFADCKNLQKAEIPPTVTYIHESAFDGCPKLEIISEPGSAARKFDDGREKGTAVAVEYEDTQGQVNTESRYPMTTGTGSGDVVSVPENGQAGEAGGQNRVSQGGNKTLGQTTVVGGQAFIFIDNVGGSVYGSTASARTNVTGNKAAETGTGTEQRSGDSSGLQFPDSAVQAPAAESSQETQTDTADPSVSAETAAEGIVSSEEDGKKSGFPKYTIVEDKIAAQAYYKDKELTSFTFPDNIKRIGDFAFSRSALTSVTIPEGVEEIGYGAFYHCDSLEQAVIPSSVTSIEPSAFEKTKWLERWRSGGNVNDYLIVGDGILLAYKGKESKITLPEGIRQIGAGVFQDHKGITSVALPNTLEIIGEDAFAGCTNLTTVSGGVAVKEIRDRAFADCPLDTVRIPQSVTSIGLRAYDSDSSARDTEHAVVFMGKSLPEVSYEKTATRLSNESSRDLAFGGIHVAVVSDSIQDYRGTILDGEKYGFRGLICSVVQEASGSAEGILKIKASTLGDLPAPESVIIYGGTYRFENQAPASENPSSVTPDTVADTPDGQQNTAVAVNVLANSSVLPDTSGISAILQGGNGSYHLVLKDSSEAGQTILKAYQTLYGEESSPELYGFDIAFYDETMSVPITKLGSSSLKVKMPLPQSMAGGNIHLVCTDEDGQLEEVAFQSYTLDGLPYMEWTAKHFSPYAIYRYEGSRPAVQENGGIFTALTRQKDASPDTGDLWHPKWFLAMGLFAASMAVFLSGRKKTIKISGT